MANIDDKVTSIRQSVYGKDVRESIASGIVAINKEVTDTTARQDVIDVQEQHRIDNEDTRQSNEQTRITNEDTRKLNETTRQQNEAIRQSNESDRQTIFNDSETARQNTFQNSESSRATTFTDSQNDKQVAFQDSEDARQATFDTNETVRQQNENTRITNEQDRQTRFEAMVHTDATLEMIDAREGEVDLKTRLDKIITVSTNEPITSNDNTFWYKDMGEAPINFNTAGDGVYTSNATVSTTEPADTGLWFEV
jgi:hypothetical protein